MHGRLLFLCLAAVPWGAHGAAKCHGRRFGDTTQRFNDTTPPNAVLYGMPEGVPPPIHLVAAMGGSFGCSTAWAVDLDTGKAWLRARCQSAEPFRDFVASMHWAGARFGSFTAFDGSPAPEAVIEGTIVLKDGETTRTLGQYYYPQASNADGKLQTAIVDAVNAATTHE
ncbi:hypothetical protein [Luteibacter yeojuensis]|uniref:Uncharacterized protein n=1 Tax=Luteibacter yeojuensis TaxID=345309 RepID=A0A0F3KY64_9GAMM|nr:hypothetical protein [Luteibacter yeojuensis]KJV36210.1 hypothetical protein VI08_05905 [Luteibacter yeojuensis]